MSDELKSCPFCGGEARIETYAGTACAVVCQMCHGGTMTMRFDDAQLAVDAWNRRAERTCRKVPGKMYYGERRPKCSECGQSLGDRRWAYCPKCGARVIEEGI